MPIKILLSKDKQKNATIGEISIIPIGGIKRLKGARNISLKLLSVLNGSFCQFIFGNQVNKIVMNKSKNIKSNILATAIVKPISTTLLRCHNHKFCYRQCFQQLRTIAFEVLKYYLQKLP